MSEAFLPTDLASFTRFKSGVQGDNVVEFIDLMVQSLNYRFTSSKINGRRKTEAVSVSIAADKLLRHYIDAKYKNANVDLYRKWRNERRTRAPRARRRCGESDGFLRTFGYREQYDEINKKWKNDGLKKLIYGSSLPESNG